MGGRGSGVVPGKLMRKESLLAGLIDSVLVTRLQTMQDLMLLVAVAGRYSQATIAVC